MNDHRVDTPLSRFTRLAAILLAIWVSWGCASTNKASSSDQTKTRASQNKEEPPPPPLQDELADAPCGNPNWARLPDQHEVDGDPDSTESSAEDETSTSDEEASPRGEDVSPKTSNDSDS